MSVFAKLRTATLNQVPGAPDAFVEIHGLSPRSLQLAAQEHQRQAMAAFKEAKAMSAAVDFDAVDPEAVKAYQTQMAKNPLLSYDAATLIEKGVTAWSFELPPTPESIEELDEDVRDYIADQILRLSKPSLYRTDEEQETDRKNG